jgi:hypothetical protein
MKYLKSVVQPFAYNLFSQVFQFVHLTKAVLLHAKKVIWWKGDIASTHFQSRTLSPRERPPGTHCTGGWLGPRAGLDTDAIGKLLSLLLGSNLDRSVVQLVARPYTD